MATRLRFFGLAMAVLVASMALSARMGQRARQMAAAAAKQASQAPATDPGAAAPNVKVAQAVPVAKALPTRPAITAHEDPATVPDPPPADIVPPATVERMRAEVRADPHKTPPSVLQFAADWGARMQAAKSDKALAERLVTQADRWVGNSAAVAPVFQAIALNNVALLVTVHPELGPRYQAMRDRADAQVVELAE